MTDKTDAWMPLWIGAYLADTLTFTTEQHGAYLLLLMAYWRERSPLPDDDEALRSIVKADRADWKRLRPVLARKFQAANGVWSHKRVEQELASANARKASAVSKAKAGSDARWEKHRKQSLSNPPSNAPSIAPGNAQAMPEHCPTPSSIPSEYQSNLTVAPARPSAEQPATLSLVQKQKRVPDCPHAEVLALWKEVLPAMPQHLPSQWRGSRADHLRARWRETAIEKGWSEPAQGIAYLRKLFGYCGQSQFLTGRAPPTPAHPRPFFIELEWLVNPANWAKVIEGKYHQEAA